MRNCLICLFIYFAVTVCDLSGQPAGEDVIKPGDLSLRIKSMNFIVNNEFYNPVVEGYTLLGFIFQPELVYTPSAKVSLRAGIHFLKYYGTEKLSMVRPVFSTNLKLSKHTTLTLGTLTGPDKHYLFDPHFHRERIYNQYVEDGIQFRAINDNIFTDTWISWENFIFKGDSTREQFTLGESFRYTSDPIAGFIRITLPIQLQIKHYGGQISDYPEKTETFFNTAGGLRIDFDLAGKNYGQAGIEYLYFANRMQKGDSIAGITGGDASWVRIHYTYKAFHFEQGYWHAHDFYAPNGNPVYGSISGHHTGEVIHDRSIITSSMYLKFSPANSLELFFGVDLFYDTGLKRLDQTYAIHLNFDKLLFLASSKRERTGN